MDSQQVNHIECQVTSVIEANEAGKGDGNCRVSGCRLNRMIRKGMAEMMDGLGAKVCGR